MSETLELMLAALDNDLEALLLLMSATTAQMRNLETVRDKWKAELVEFESERTFDLPS
jgi:hypothetical protein